jgi:hypothetical protein
LFRNDNVRASFVPKRLKDVEKCLPKVD